MRSILIVVISSMIYFSCDNKPSLNQSQGKYEQFYIRDIDSTSTPTIKIHGLTLVTKNIDDERRDAIEILKLKHSWPLAMQTKNRELFEKILSKDFTFRGEDEFYTKTDYIDNREVGTWTIDTVTYENLVLQFFDGRALLTYRNILNGTDKNGVEDTEYYCWADIYVKESDGWKILGSHNIEGRIEYKNK
jgi:hypothetical protein